MFSVRTPEYNEEISPNLNPQGKEGVKGDDYFLGLLPGIIGGKILQKKIMLSRHFIERYLIDISNSMKCPSMSVPTPK